MVDKKLHTVSNLAYEQAAWGSKQLVCGIDEVGRGCLAGPVVAAAVIMPVGAVIDNVRDSKLIMPKELQILAEKIMQQAWFGFGIVNPYLIDNCNINRATSLAMCRAVNNLFAICPILPQKLLIDAVDLSSFFGKQITCVSKPKGETWSYSIAAASIIAKVKRDQLMQKYAKIFEDFGLDKHKGYGTAEHYASLEQHGKTILHRATFLKKFYAANDFEHNNQQIKLF